MQLMRVYIMEAVVVVTNLSAITVINEITAICEVMAIPSLSLLWLIFDGCHVGCCRA